MGMMLKLSNAPLSIPFLFWSLLWVYSKHVSQFQGLKTYPKFCCFWLPFNVHMYIDCWKKWPFFLFFLYAQYTHLWIHVAPGVSNYSAVWLQAILTLFTSLSSADNVFFFPTSFKICWNIKFLCYISIHTPWKQMQLNKTICLASVYYFLT